jgi:hypothetical protein
VFWLRVANELGTSRLRIDKLANSIHQFLDKDSDSKLYLRDLIKKSYKLSRCQHLASPISLEVVLDLLGETAHKLRGDQRDDLFDIELLEEIAWHINDRYWPEIQSLLPCDENDDGAKTSAQILSFPNFKIRRANNRN